jgi:hypothetical protein
MRNNQMTDQPGENPTEPTPEDSAAPPPAPPPASPTPPPAAPAGDSAGTAGSRQFDADKTKAAIQGAHKFDLGMIGAGVVAWLAGFLPFYTASASFAGHSVSAHESAYHGFFGWFAVWVALAVAVLVALALLGVDLPLPVPMAQAALGGFGLALLCLVLALFITPGGDACNGAGAFGVDCSTGRGFGFWLALILVIAGGVLAFLRARDTMTKTAAA